MITDEMVELIGLPIATPRTNARVVVERETPASALDAMVGDTLAETVGAVAGAVMVESKKTDAVPAT